MQKHSKKLTWLLLAIYIASTIYLTVLCRTAGPEMQSNLELFWELKTYLSGNKEFANQICRNILLFIPIGFLAYSASRSYKLSFLIGLITSLIIELSQLLFKLGLFEFDDILNNTIGTIIGIAFSAALAKIIKNEKAYTIITLIGAMIAIGISVYANVKY